MHVIRGEERHPQRVIRDIFTGEVETAPYADEGTAQHLRVNLVRFRPGGRTKWHTHTFEQGLLVVEGRGIVATDQGEHLVGPGDFVVVPANERHWHGGTERTAMAHFSIATPGETTVLEPVERIQTEA